MYSIQRTPHYLLGSRRLYVTLPPSGRPVRTPGRPLRATALFVSALSGAAVLGLYSDARSCPTPPFQLANDSVRPAHDLSPPLRALLRTYLVYTLTSFETLVDHAPDILEAFLKVPIVGTAVEGIVRRTFFDHFVGGETARAASPLLATLRRQNKGALLAYSVEVDAHEAAGAGHQGEGHSQSSNPEERPVHKRIVAEMIRSIDVAADFEDQRPGATGDVAGRRTWVAIKLTALLPNADALRHLSLHVTRTRPASSPPVPFPGTPESSDLAVLDGRIPVGSPLTAQDAEDLRELYLDLNRICACARDRNVRVVLDAEHSWYQPAIDAFGHALMGRFNKLPNAQGTLFQPIVYVTYQAYLRRTPAHLTRSLELAGQNDYALGVKLVRGAYHPHEIAAFSAAMSSSASASVGISPDPYPPVHPTKTDTDACYNECAALLVKTIADDVKSSRGRAPHVDVLFGTHNWLSCELVLGELVKNGLARQDTPDVDGIRRGTIVVGDDVAKRLVFGQLHGMSDSLTDYLVGRMKSSTPCVIKYVPYGALVEVMPYISRRAIENKSVLGHGGAVRERKEAAKQIWIRVFGGAGL